MANRSSENLVQFKYRYPPICEVKAFHETVRKVKILKPKTQKNQLIPEHPKNCSVFLTYILMVNKRQNKDSIICLSYLLLQIKLYYFIHVYFLIVVAAQ
jgi:hypothetical protein